MMRSESPAAYDPRLDHDVDFHADRSLLSRAHNAPVRGVAPGSAGPGRAIASGTTGGARWRQREAIAFARLGILEFVATYMFALLSVGVVVSTAVARNRLSDAELTGSRLVAIALCSSLCFAALHWAFNLYAADMQQQAGPPHRLVASKLAMPAAASSGHRMTGDSSLQGMALGMAGSGSGAGLGTREPAIVTLLGSAPIAHMNPAVTLALLAATGMHYVVAIIFLVAQILAAILAATTVWAATPAEFTKHVAGLLASPESTWWQDFFCELILTIFAFASVVSYAASRGVSPSTAESLQSGFDRRSGTNVGANDSDWEIVEDDEGDVFLHDRQAGQRQWMHGASVLRRQSNKAAHYEDKLVRGLASGVNVSAGFGAVFAPLFCATFVAAAVSAGSLNPALSFGVSLVANKWKLHWLRWAAPVLGAMVLGFAVEGFGVVCGRKRKTKRGQTGRKERLSAPAPFLSPAPERSDRKS